MSSIEGQIGNVLINSELTGCLVFDRSGRLHFANRAISNYLNMPETAILQLSLEHVLPYNEYQYATNAISEFLETGEFEELLWTITAQNGKPYKFKIEPFRITHEGEHMVCVLVHDAKETALKDRLIDSTQKLEYLAHQQELAIRTAKLGVWKLNLENGETTWNDEMLRMYDISRDEFNEDQNHWQELVHPDDKSFIEQEMYKITQGKSVEGIEFRILTRQGNIRHVQASGAPIYNNDGEIIEITGVNIDITHLIEAQQQILENQQQLKDSLKEKEILLMEIHHRVKNNLAIVSGLLDLQIMKQREDAHRVILRDARNRIQSIAMVHEQLYKEMEFSSIDLASYYPKLFKNLQGNILSGDDKIEFDLKFELPNLNINRAVPMGLLITELFINSVKYAMRNHFLKITFHITEKNDLIHVLYEDNGAGFDQEKVKQNKTLGWEIIHTILKQLEADYSINSEDKFRLEFSFEENVRGSHSAHEKVLESVKTYRTHDSNL